MLEQASIWGLQNKEKIKYIKNWKINGAGFQILKFWKVKLGFNISLQENQKLQRRELKYCLDARNLKIGFYKMKIITHELSWLSFSQSCLWVWPHGCGKNGRNGREMETGAATAEMLWRVQRRWRKAQLFEFWDLSQSGEEVVRAGWQTRLNITVGGCDSVQVVILMFSP